MPITKERMHALLQAAQTIEQHAKATCEAILHTCQQVTLNTQSPANALAQIANLAATIDQRIRESSHLLQLEAMHYRLTHKKTEYDRLRRQLLRGQHQDIANLIQPHTRERRTTVRTPHTDALAPTIQYDEDTLRELVGGDDAPYVPLVSSNTSPDFEGPFKSEQQITLDQVNSTIGQPHEATLHEDQTISCSCGKVYHKSRTVWNEHYLMTHPTPITR